MYLTVEVTGPQAENWPSGAGYGQCMVVVVERQRVVDDGIRVYVCSGRWNSFW